MSETVKNGLLTKIGSMFGGTTSATSDGYAPLNDKRISEYYSQGDSHTTTGIPYAIHGTARVVQTNVTDWLAGYIDPIKAILGTSVQNSQKVIITRKYVVGGGAIITPEHAPARAVAIREDTREVRLTRYGGDIEMNLNLFLLPTAAEEEFAMKLDAQRGELEQTLTGLAYEAVMNQSIPLEIALSKANPASPDGRFQDIYVKSVFGAMAKHPFPVANLVAAVRHANMYTPSSSGSGGGVLMVPPGMLDLAHYTRPDSMKYSVSGFKQTEQPVGIEMEVAYEPQLGTRIVVSKRPSNSRDASSPSLDGAGYLNELATWSTYYEIPGPNLSTAGATAWDTAIEKLSAWTVGVASTVANSGVIDVANTARIGTLITKAGNAIRADRAHGINRGDYTTEIVEFDCVDATEKAAYAIIIGNAAAAKTTFVDAWKVVVAADVDGVQYGIVNHVTGAIESLDAGTYYRPAMTAMMGSAIYAREPGANTGEMLFAYPSAGLKSDQTTEMLSVQLRVYMGTILF